MKAPLIQRKGSKFRLTYRGKYLEYDTFKAAQEVARQIVKRDNSQARFDAATQYHADHV